MTLMIPAVTADAQPHFPTPEAAVDALIEAAGAEDRDAVLGILGPQGAALRSGDPVADNLERKGFVAAAKEKTRIELDGDATAILNLGKDDWPFPIPLIKEASGWRFDTAAGIEELLDRRIGRNELYAIAVARELVEAQYDYATRDRDGDGEPEFAQKLLSTESRRDGLYWPTTEDENESPLGRLVAEAVATGYGPGESEGPHPYHGYYYRLLTSQGANAPGGAKNYLVDGQLTRGFALLANPAEYGNSGIMSFLVNQSGILYQKDLGEDTAAVAAAITEFNPDESWRPVAD
jgi:hypothetical protein